MFTRRVDEELELALLELSHAEELFALIDAERDYLARWLPWPRATRAVDDTRAFIRFARAEWAAERAVVCAILRHGTIVGLVSLQSINSQLKKAMIGYWLSERCQGQGVMTRAARHMLAYGFDVLRLEKIEIHAAVENRPSRAICERLGLTYEGTLRRAERLDDRVVDHALYGMLREEYEALRRGDQSNS